MFQTTDAQVKVHYQNTILQLKILPILFLRSASTAEIVRISQGANFRATPVPKERKMSSSSSSNSEAQNRRFKNENNPPSYQQHISSSVMQRPSYQSPLSESFNFFVHANYALQNIL